MPNKFSKFPSASQPLVGNELVPMLQSGLNVTAPLSTVGGSGGSDVSSLTANWESTYTTFSTNSGDYAVTNADNNFTSTQTFTTSAINLGAIPFSVSLTEDLRMGRDAGINAESSIFGSNIFIGTSAGAGAAASNPTWEQIAIGGNAGSNTDQNESSIFVGYDSGKNSTLNSTSIMIGFEAGESSTSCIFSNFIGTQAGQNADTSTSSNFIGSGAGKNANASSNSIFLGGGCGENAANSSNSIFAGYRAGRDSNDTTGSVFIGYYAGNAAPYSKYSTFLGHLAGYQSLSSTYSNYMGYQSGTNIKNGKYNVMIGSDTGTISSSVSSVSACIALGSGAQVTGSNQLALGSSTYPLSVIPGVSLTSPVSGLRVIVNGVTLTIPLI